MGWLRRLGGWLGGLQSLVEEVVDLCIVVRTGVGVFYSVALRASFEKW